MLNIHQLFTSLRSQCTSDTPHLCFALNKTLLTWNSSSAQGLLHRPLPAAVLLSHWMSNLGVPCSSQFFLSLSIQPIKILLILSAWQLFLSLHTAELSSKLSVILHLGYCNIISLASAAVVWPGLYLFGILPLKSFVASHLTGNQPTFDSICVISDISCMSWTWTSVLLTHFSLLKPFFKFWVFSCLRKLDCD